MLTDVFQRGSSYYLPEAVSFGEPMVEFNARIEGRLRDVELFERGFGGDTSNMAIALTRLGHSCGYITKVGADEFGASLINLWSRENVDISHVIVEKKGFTGIYFVARMTNGSHEFTYYRRGSAASHFSPEDLDMEYINRAKVFHTSGITQAISVSCRRAVERVLDELDRTRVLVSYDPNLRLRLWSLPLARRIILRTIARSDIVFPSFDDAKALLKERTPEDLAKRMLELGCRLVAMKMGSEGCIVAERSEIVKVPAFPVKVVDTTGAGDAFDAGFIASILEGKNSRDSAIFANAVAALKCQGKGAVISQPKRSDVECFLKQ
ncbi:MAG: sugar kinase [Candidatus Bathyarchaeia archaeon]